MLRIRNLCYRYPNRKKDTLKNINLQLQAGEMLLLAGRSGCGKSTLIKAVSGILRMEKRGCLRGEIYLNGENIAGLMPEDIGQIAGTVYQTPDDQLFAMTVYDEAAFALENQGYGEDFIRERVLQILSLVGLKGMEYFSIHTLSGGQRQRLALASVLVTNPGLLILDEPVSQMNPQGVRDFLHLLVRLKETQGLTILMIEHRIHELAEYFQRIAVMDNGRIVYDGSMEKVWTSLPDELRNGLREPQNIRLCRELHLPEWSNDKEKVLQMIKGQCRISDSPPLAAEKAHKTCLFWAEHVSFCYEGKNKDILHDLNFVLHAGEMTALMGRNGAGKSTLMNLIGGVFSLQKGRIFLEEKALEESLSDIGYLRQEADLMLLADTVRKEFYWNNKSLAKEEYETLIKNMGLTGYEEDFPPALSKGQRLRVILGAVLARKPKLLLLDEPTAGQDQESLDAIKRLLCNYVQGGGCVCFCTHDVELAAEIADHVILMAEGRIVADGTAGEVLSDSDCLAEGGLEAPDMLELSARLHLPPCLTVKEVEKYVHEAALGRE